MSGNQRIALVVAALAVAVVAFLVARPGDDEDSTPSSSTTPAETERQTSPEPETATEAPPPEPQVARIRLRGGEVVGGARTIEAGRGDVVRIVIRSDVPDEFHLHGYDIYRDGAPGQPARFSFRADAEGEFELESHTAEDAGNEPLVARLLIGPS